MIQEGSHSVTCPFNGDNRSLAGIVQVTSNASGHRIETGCDAHLGWAMADRFHSVEKGFS